jgi:large subunit ribosomal protein L25
MAQQTEQVGLTAEKRTVIGKHVKQLRRQGWVPGVMYGHGFDSVPLRFEKKSLRHVLSKVGGSQLISINIEGNKQPEMALVRDVQRDPIKGSLLHVDFYRVRMTERLTTEVPLVIVGESPVAEAREGILLQGVSSIEVECLPGDLVDAIEVDLTDLVEIDQALYVRDLAVPAGIDVLTDLDEMVARVVPLEAEEVEEEEEVIPEAEEVEVITEAREEEAAGGED